MKKIFTAFTAFALMFACTPEENNTSGTEDSGSGKDNLVPSVTVEADHISAVSVVLYGKANLGSTVAADLQVGFQYSKSAGILPSNSTTIEATDADASYNYTASITCLEPDTKYYFRSFVRQNSQYTYGQTKEFTTKDVASLLETREASGVEAAMATMNAKLDLTDVIAGSISLGFLWGNQSYALDKNYECTAVEGNAISAVLTNLSHKTQYWYKAYVTLDGRTFHGEVKTFTTDVVPVESISLDKTDYTFNTIGYSLMLTATVLPADATDKTMSWASDNESVATVSSNGMVKAIGNGIANITVTSIDQGKTASCFITVSQWVTSISLDKTTISLNEGQEQVLTPTVNPSNAVDRSVVWTSSNASVAMVDSGGKITAVSKGTTIVKATANDGSGKSASCSVTVIEPFVFGPVDLGLHSRLKWANANLGASKPEDYGDYYAWGETETKYNYSWSNYKWGTSSTSLTKYNTKSADGTVDNNTVLDLEDDVAHVKLGGSWRMPTDDEWTELRTECTWSWTTQNGVKGRLVTGKNGNSIFLPAAGGWGSTGLGNADSSGNYWSSSIITDSPYYAWYVYFNSGKVASDFLSRCYGRSVRPVTE